MTAPQTPPVPHEATACVTTAGGASDCAPGLSIEFRDYVNEHFRQFYPADHKQQWETAYLSSGSGRRYTGDLRSNIFPCIVCADGFEMSVQGHFGAYSRPRDDFADEYSMVEIMCAETPEFGDGDPSDGEFVYAYVPVKAVNAFIESRGGIAVVQS